MARWTPADPLPSRGHQVLSRALLHALIHALLAGAACGECPPLTSTTVTVSVVGNVTLLSCANTALVFPSSDRVLLDVCVGSSWTIPLPLPACITPPTLIVTSCTTTVPQDPPNTTVVQTFLDASQNVYAKYYECVDGQAWLSGLPGTFAQCKTGQWTPVFDVCTEPCPIPRDCVDIFSLGFNTTGPYTVIPSGVLYQPSITVWCELDSGSVWTTALMISSILNSLTLTQYQNGNAGTSTLAVPSVPYFIGISNLAYLTLNLDGTPRPHVFQFTVKSTSGSWYATYDNVTIGPAPNYTLLSVGNIYGNAGDGFSLSLGYNFVLDSGSSSSQWWWPADASSRNAFCNGNAACVTQLKWGPLSNHGTTVSSIYMRVRPQEYDSGINCPVINVMSLPYQPNSYYMLANVSQSRVPGTTISYQCLREYRMEGPTGGPYTTQGVTTCQGVPGSGNLVWSRNLTLPCQLRCPDTFQQWSDANTCYNASMDRAVMGISGAALRCSQVNASLAVILNAIDLQNLNSTDFYLTAHIVNKTSTSIQPALPPNTTCVGVCPPASGGPRCVVVNQAGQYKAGDCTSTDFRYICQLPPVCPVGYTPYRGNCYKLRVSVTAGIVAAQSTCEGDGASLAYPQTVDTVQFMARLNISTTGSTSGTFGGSAMIGINGVGGNWSAGGLYPLDAGVLNMTNSSTVTATSLWRAVSASATTLTAIPITATIASATITKAICQLYGPVGCWTPPPPPTVNMTQAWSNSTLLETTVNYTCILGYFVNGNITRTYQVLTCYGLVGGWYPPLLNECYHVPVCNSKPPVSPTYVTNTTDIEYRYLGGTINYTCPYMMAVNSTGVTTQTITCVANMTSFNFSPLTVQPCTVCLGQPNITNASTDWLGTNTYLINNTVNATCDANHLFKIGATSSPIPCLPTGWGNGTCYEGCVMDPPAPGANMTRSNTTTYAVGTTIVYTCAQGYNIPPTAVNQTYLTSVNVTCNASSHSWAAGGLLECAKLCMVDPIKVVAPANSSWDGFSRVAGTQVTYTCPSGYAFADLNTTIVLTCGDNGQWTPATSILLTCRKVCPTSLPATPVNATQVGAVFPYWVGDSVTFRCPKDMQSAGANTSVSLNCSDTGWSALDPQFGCYNVCRYAPPFVVYGNSSWDGVNIIFGSQVTLSCPGTLSLGDLNQSLTVTCQDDGNWTYVDPDILICRQECTAALPTLPTNATLEGPPVPYWVGTHVNFTCDLGTASPTGGTYNQIECLDGGWTPLVAGFMCIPACVAAPPAAGDTVTSNDTGVQVYGTVITYTCAYTFYNDTYTLNTLCDEGNWTLPTLPKCALDPNAPLPSTEAPFTFPDADVLTQAYINTTNFHVGEMAALMTSVNGAGNNFERVSGPFSFAYGVRLNANNAQCLSMLNFVSNTSCIYDPSKCTQGLSFSIWERKNFSLQEFLGARNYLSYPMQYLLSTGGDTNGHPGVALYNQGLFLVALVSTGNMYWQEKVVGAVGNFTWTNIGIRWDPTNGIEGFINDRSVFFKKTGVASTGQTTLNPPEVMIGCHKDATNLDYRYYDTGDLDELAFWERRLADNETVYFLGGYEGEQQKISPDEFSKLLDSPDSIDLSDPVQQQEAVGALEAMTDPVYNPPVNLTNNTQATSARLHWFNTTVTNIRRVADPDDQPACINIADASKSLDLIGTMSNLMDSSRKEDWSLYLNATGRDALNLCDDLEPYFDTIAQSLQCNNVTRFTATVTKDYANLQLDKIPVQQLTSSRKSLPTPTFVNPSQLADTWGISADKVEVPNTLFSDPRCKTRTINVISTLYNNYHNIMSLPLNLSARVFNAGAKYKLLSRVIGVTMSTDPILLASGVPDPKIPRCNPDPSVITVYPILVTLFHLDPNIILRKPLFHGDGDIIYPSIRHCVWWNPELSGWDKSGCRVFTGANDFTKCSCAQAGKYAILAEEVEPAVLPAEASWMRILRYVLYGVSALCLLLFILVVAFSGDLKEQFHLMGMTLAGTLLLASLFMVLSDLPSVRDGRHMCTAFGTVLHFLYLCAGAWVAMIGHATFNCITAGIIGGRLGCYGCLSVGITLVSVGLGYTFFLQDLGTDPRCFISFNNFPKLLFFSPQVAFCCMGLFCGVVIFFNMRTASLRNNPGISDYRSFSLGAAVFSIYFSLTWAVGTVTYLQLGLKVDLYPFFQVLNGLMGVVLLLCLGAGSSRFRMVLAGQAKRRREMLLSYARRGSGEDTRRLGSPADQRRLPPTTPPQPPTTPPQPPTTPPQPPTTLPPQAGERSWSNTSLNLN